ncbi:MAG: hypothetical protein J6C81_02825 [Muribaculaceae bacterium]|nr:hypothetical protein [Muribaculaceae bacterium]
MKFLRLPSALLLLFISSITMAQYAGIPSHLNENSDYAPISNDPGKRIDVFADSSRYTIRLNASTMANVGSGDFAPRLVTANQGGLITQPLSILEKVTLSRPMKRSDRFSYGFGGSLVLDAACSTEYERWSIDNNGFVSNNQHPSYLWLQELYGEIKFRSVYLLAGLKENDRSIFDGVIGSGDLTLSNNARPIPQVRIGFIDFRDIPLTNGWVQIQGDIAYGVFTDQHWTEDHYNYFNSFITTGNLYHYKRCYFRTKPEKPFSVTVGMQHASQFHGTWKKYNKGVMTKEVKDKLTFRDFIDVFYQTKGNNSVNPGDAVNFNGNHLGSWDVQFRYRFRDGTKLTFYVQKPWEDESGVAWRTGFDGVWGLRYDAPSDALVDGAAIEYLDFTNQGGPMLWDPSPSIPTNASGADDYYNNFMYNGWVNYGLAIGSPIFKAPLYNTDGYMRFTDNHLRGFHLGVKGRLMRGLRWRALFSFLSSNGTPLVPREHHRDVSSFLLEAAYQLPSVPNLTFKGQIAFDAGSLYRPAFGMFVSASYSGSLSFKK